MPSKIQQAMDILELIPEPTTINILAIRKKLKCSERHVWRALRRLRENRFKASEEVSKINQLESEISQMWSDLFFFYDLFRKLQDPYYELKATEERKITKLEDKLRELGYPVED